MSVRSAEVVSSFSSPSSDCKVPPQKKKTEQKKERFLEPSGPEPLACSEVSPGHLGNQREHLLLLLRGPTGGRSFTSAYFTRLSN